MKKIEGKNQKQEGRFFKIQIKQRKQHHQNL
jgi:hypothetical protein